MFVIIIIVITTIVDTINNCDERIVTIENMFRAGWDNYLPQSLFGLDILEYYGNNISVEERVYRILYFYSRLVAQQGLEYSNNILKNSKIMCYSGFLGTFGTELMALHNTYPNWNANNSFHRITSIYNLFLAYEKSIKMIR